MTEEPSPAEQPVPADVRSWGTFFRQLWLGAVPVLFVAMLLAGAVYGWKTYRAASAKARDREFCQRLQDFLVEFQDTRDRQPADFGAIRSKAVVISSSIPEAMKRDLSPGMPARQRMVWAARDELPRMMQQDLTTISESEVEFARNVLQASTWLDLPPPALRKQPRQIAEGLAEIERLGGFVATDEQRPVQPVTAIEMTGEHFNDQHLAALPNVSSLTIGSSAITDAGLRNLQTITNLKTLSLNCSKITDAGIEGLSRLPALETVLLLKCSRVTDNGLLSLKKARDLTLVGQHITDETLVALKEFPDLQQLTLQSDTITDEGLSLLASHAGLTTLSLAHCHELSDEGLARVAEIQTLTTLRIQGVDLTDRALDSVGLLPGLKHLMIYPCNERMRSGLRITDAGLARMKNRAELHSLAVEFCPGLTDSSVDVLADMSSLGYLTLKETAVTAEGYQQLVSLRPEIRVDFVPAPPSPLDATLASGAGNNTPSPVGPACRPWPVPDSSATVGGQTTIEKLETEYRKSPVATDRKYAGKWIDLSGRVSHVGNNLEGDPIIRLRGSDDQFDVNCVLRKAAGEGDAVEGEICRLRGVYCPSVLPVLIHCTVTRAADQAPNDAGEGAAAIDKAIRGPPDFTVTAEQLEAEVAADPSEAQRKYAGKTLQVTGRISRISHVVAGAMVYRMGGLLSTQYFPRMGSPWYCVRPGQKVTLVGRWFHAYPCLVDCELISLSGGSFPTIPATSLGEYLESDRALFRKWFYQKQFIVSGKVIEKSAPDDYPDQISITLQSTEETNVVCKMEIEEFRATESVQVGETVEITGWNTLESPTDEIRLVGCLLWRGG